MFYNKTGLQPVSRPVERVHYLGGWSRGSKSLWSQSSADSYIAGYACKYREVFGRFRGKTSLTKNFHMNSRGVGWGVGGNLGSFQPLFQDLCSIGKNSIRLKKTYDRIRWPKLTIRLYFFKSIKTPNVSLKFKSSNVGACLFFSVYYVQGRIQKKMLKSWK